MLRFTKIYMTSFTEKRDTRLTCRVWWKILLATLTSPTQALADFIARAPSPALKGAVEATTTTFNVYQFPGFKRQCCYTGKW